LALERKSLQPEIVGRGARLGQRLGRVYDARVAGPPVRRDGLDGSFFLGG
jgi:hypothetical protein